MENVHCCLHVHWTIRIKASHSLCQWEKQREKERERERERGRQIEHERSTSLQKKIQGNHYDKKRTAIYLFVDVFFIFIFNINLLCLKGFYWRYIVFMWCVVGMSCEIDFSCRTCTFNWISFKSGLWHFFPISILFMMNGEANKRSPNVYTFNCRRSIKWASCVGLVWWKEVARFDLNGFYFCHGHFQVVNEQSSARKNVTNDCKSPIEMDGGRHSLGGSTQWTRIASKRSQTSLYSQSVRFGITKNHHTATNHQLMALFVLPRFILLSLQCYSNNFHYRSPKCVFQLMWAAKNGMYASHTPPIDFHYLQTQPLMIL